VKKKYAYAPEHPEVLDRLLFFKCEVSNKIKQKQGCFCHFNTVIFMFYLLYGFLLFPLFDMFRRVYRTRYHRICDLEY